MKRHYLEPLSFAIAEVAGDLGMSRKALPKIINDREFVTAEMDLRLSKAFNTPVEHRPNLQDSCDYWLVRIKSGGLENIRNLVPA